MRLDGTWPIPSVSRLNLSALPIDVSDFQAIMCGALARDAAEVSTAGRAFSEGVSKVKVNIIAVSKSLSVALSNILLCEDFFNSGPRTQGHARSRRLQGAADEGTCVLTG